MAKRDKDSKLERQRIERLALNAYEGCDGCTEFDKKMWVDGFVLGYITKQIELNKNHKKCN